MSDASLSSVLKVFYSIRVQLEQGSEFNHDDPAVIELKKQLLQAIANLEALKPSTLEQASLDKLA